MYVASHMLFRYISLPRNSGLPFEYFVDLELFCHTFCQVLDKTSCLQHFIGQNNNSLLIKNYNNIAGSDQVGSDQVGSDQVGSNQVGSDQVGSNQVGSNQVGSNHNIAS